MTEESGFVGYLQFVYIDGNGIDARINDNPDYKFKLPKNWRNSLVDEKRRLDDIATAVYGACHQYNLDYVSEDMVAHAVSEALDSFRQCKGGTQKPSRGDEEPADILYKLAQHEIQEMFRDEELKTPYAVFTVDGKIHVLNMDDEEFALKLAMMYENHIHSLPVSDESALVSETDLKKVIRNLKARNENYRTLNTRSYFDEIEGAVYYDFENKEYQQAKITEHGYEILGNSYLSFRQLDDHHVQTLPNRDSTNGGELLDNLIKSFYILDDSENDDKNLLFKISLISKYFGPNTMLANPIDAVNGPPGAAKTSLLMIKKFLYDPVDMGNIKRIKLMLTPWGGGRPEDARNRKLAVSREGYTLFDNIGHHLSGPEQDEMSMYSTGGVNKERKLHTNTGLVEYSFRCFVGYTSIYDIVSQSDVIGRQLRYEVDIKKDSLSERLFWEKNIAARPAILHYIFTVISRAIPIYTKLLKTIERTSQRLSDFIVLGEAISQALGEPANRFMEMMNNLNNEQNERSIDNNLVVSSFVDYILNDLMLQHDTMFTIHAKDLHSGLAQHYQNSGGNTHDPFFPQNPIKLANRLTMFKAALQNNGISIEKAGRDNKGMKYVITINKKTDGTNSNSNNDNRPTDGDNSGQQALGAGTTQKGEVFICPFCDHQSPSIEELEQHSIKSHSGKPYAAERSNQKLFWEIFNALIDSNDNEIEEKLLIDELVKTGRFDGKKAREMISKFNREGRIYQRKENTWSKA
jgi:hypothetical protein